MKEQLQVIVTVLSLVNHVVCAAMFCGPNRNALRSTGGRTG
jgi:hypothetical protein